MVTNSNSKLVLEVKNLRDFVAFKSLSMHRLTKEKLRFGYLKNAWRNLTPRDSLVISTFESISTQSERPLYEKWLEESYLCKRNLPLSFLYFIRILGRVLFDRKLRAGYGVRFLFNYCIFDSIANFLKSKKLSRVDFLSFAYDYDLVMLSKLLVTKGITTVFHHDQGFLPYSGPVFSSVVVYRTRFQQSYHKAMGWDEYSDQTQIKYKVRVSDVGNRSVIGIYPSGFQARAGNDVSQEYQEQRVKSEQKMIFEAINLAIVHSSTRFRLYIHRHGGIEDDRSALRDYNDLLALNNVELMGEDNNSIKEFNEVDLAITCVSEIFFDRLERGYPALLSNCFEKEFLKLSGLMHMNANSSAELLKLYNSDLSVN